VVFLAVAGFAAGADVAGATGAGAAAFDAVGFLAAVFVGLATGLDFLPKSFFKNLNITSSFCFL
jgi:hypothetical protein